MLDHLVHSEIAAKASQLTPQQWSAIQERFAAFELSQQQRDDWAAIRVELEADLNLWRLADANPLVSRADFSQLLWSHCRLLAKFHALLLGIAELTPEAIDEDAIMAFMLFTEDDCEPESLTLR
jgi:hypothetical protein